MKKSCLLDVACACLTCLVSFSVHAVAVSGQGTWETTLLARDLDGDLSTVEAYYDVILDITWLANQNGAGDGVRNQIEALNWVAGLDFNGISEWRLPRADSIDGTTADDLNFSYIGTEDRGYNVSAPGTLFAGSTANEMAHMFHHTLGNLGYCNPNTSTVTNCDIQSGWGFSNTGPLSTNINSNDHWTETTFAPDSGRAWTFNLYEGFTRYLHKTNHYALAWAVHDGDVGAAVVPIPAAAWLFGSGLLGLIGVTRKKVAN